MIFAISLIRTILKNEKCIYISLYKIQKKYYKFNISLFIISKKKARE